MGTSRLLPTVGPQSQSRTPRGYLAGTTNREPTDRFRTELHTSFRPKPYPQGGEQRSRDEACPNGDLDTPDSYVHLEDYS